jgi:hypothetical protein
MRGVLLTRSVESEVNPLLRHLASDVMPPALPDTVCVGELLVSNYPGLMRGDVIWNCWLVEC